jgi:hypothetical protein
VAQFTLTRPHTAVLPTYRALALASACPAVCKRWPPTRAIGALVGLWWPVKVGGSCGVCLHSSHSDARSLRGSRAGARRCRAHKWRQQAWCRTQAAAANWAQRHVCGGGRGQGCAQGCRRA